MSRVNTLHLLTSFTTTPVQYRVVLLRNRVHLSAISAKALSIVQLPHIVLVANALRRSANAPFQFRHTLLTPRTSLTAFLSPTVLFPFHPCPAAPEISCSRHLTNVTPVLLPRSFASVFSPLSDGQDIFSQSCFLPPETAPQHPGRPDVSAVRPNSTAFDHLPEQVFLLPGQFGLCGAGAACSRWCSAYPVAVSRMLCSLIAFLDFRLFKL